MTIPSIRHNYPSLSTSHHFNCGGIAPLSNEVGAEMLRVPRYIIESGPAPLLAHDEAFLGIDAARATMARLMGADTDEIAFTTQFSTAINILTEGLHWETGQEVIVTDQEHPAMLIPLMNTVKRHGLIVHRIPWSHDQQQMLDAFLQVLSPKTRLVAMSHVTTDSGAILPVEEITRHAHQAGALVLFDGAHSMGQLPVDVHSLGCDFYAIVGYKWLMGPYPTAMLYVRRDRLHDIEVSWSGSYSTTGATVTLGPDEIEWRPGMARFEYGARVYSWDTAMALGAAGVEKLGLDKVLAHERMLGRRFHDGLAAIPGISIQSPTPEMGTGINCLSLDGMNGVELSQRLRDDYQIVQRPALWGKSIRISLASFIENDDVDYLLNAIEVIARG